MTHYFYFNVPAEVQDVTEGPSVTRFELSVEKVLKFQNYGITR